MAGTYSRLRGIGRGDDWRNVGGRRHGRDTLPAMSEMHTNIAAPPDDGGALLDTVTIARIAGVTRKCVQYVAGRKLKLTPAGRLGQGLVYTPADAARIVAGIQALDPKRHKPVKAVAQ